MWDNLLWLGLLVIGIFLMRQGWEEVKKRGIAKQQELTASCVKEMHMLTNVLAEIMNSMTLLKDRTLLFSMLTLAYDIKSVTTMALVLTAQFFNDPEVISKMLNDAAFDNKHDFVDLAKKLHVEVEMRLLSDGKLTEAQKGELVLASDLLNKVIQRGGAAKLKLRQALKEYGYANRVN